MAQCVSCGAASAAAVCAACWRTWPGVEGLSPTQLLSAATDRRQSAAVERLLSSFSSLVGEVLRHASALARDMFGSHVLQSALAALGRALADRPAPHLAEAAAAAADAVLTTAWRSTAADSCGTHCARSLLLLLAGACPPKRKPPAKRGGKLDDTWPTAGFDAAAFPCLRACLLRVAAAAAAALRAGGVRHACDVHAAPVLALLLRALARTREPAALQELLDALFAGDRAAAARSLAASPAGSRVLEAALEAAAPGAFDALLRDCVLPHAPAWLGGAASAVAATGPTISFVLAADGSARAFRPGADESQWWCRRDAHVRIAAAALWSGDGAPQAGVQECALLYADASVMRMQAAALAARCAVPTEAALVEAWRDAAAGKRVPGVRAWRPGCDDAAEALRAAFGELLGPAGPGRTVVVSLHEDYPVELPVWGRQHSGGGDDISRIVFLMGAVRDLTPEEEEAAAEVAHARGFAFLGANLGRMPEFSSKVVAALCVHHANGRLVPAAAALARRADAAELPKLEPAPSRRSKRPSTLRFVLRVPFIAGELTADVAHRAMMHTLLQTCVCALWRSRLADEEQQGGGAELACSLAVQFADGALLRVDAAFVSKLAACHQAAPSEAQVLSALVQEPCVADADAVRLLLAELPAATVLELQVGAGPGGACNLAALAYADRCACGTHAPARRGDVVILLNVPAPSESLARRARLAPPGHALSCAAAVTFIQQLHFHGRLFPALDLCGSDNDAAAPAAGPAAPAAAPAAAPCTGTERFVVAACFRALHDDAQLLALLRCVERAPPLRDTYAVAAAAALRLGAAHDAVATAAISALVAEGGDDDAIWPSLLCGPGGQPCEAGGALLCALLKFPASDATAPLRRGFRALLRGSPHLRAWALHNDGSRALEAAMQPAATALPAKLQRRAVRAYLDADGLVPALCVHPKASWLVAALWEAVQGGGDDGMRAALRATFAAQLLSVAELQAANPRLWQRCGLDAWLPAAKRQKC